MGKRFFFAILIICIFGNVSCSTNAHAPDYDSLTAEVDAYIEDFEKNKDRCEQKEVYYDVSTEGGSITGYYAEDMLKYMEAAIYGETFRCRYDIYYVNESFTYYVLTWIDYDKPFYEEGYKEKETISKYIIINQDVYEYTNELNPVDEKDEIRYMELIQDFERSLME